MCQPRRALCSDPDRGMPTAFTASCFETWMRTLQEQGDERSLTDVRLLAQDKKYRAEFKLRHENWRYAMEVIESFGSSRTADRREGAAYRLAKTSLPKAAVGWSDELRQYTLELMSRAGVRDAVSVAADEVRKLESSYGKLTEGQQCDGAPDERASAIGDRLVVARTLHRSLPPAPQAMEQGTAATQSVAYVTCLVASIMFAILFVLRWSCQRHVRILQRKHGGARTYGCRGTFEQLGRVGIQWWESAVQYAGQWRQEQPAVVVTAPAQRQAQRKRKPPKGAKAARKQPEPVLKASADKQATQGSESPPHKAKKKVGKKAPNQKVEKKPEVKKQEKKTKEKQPAAKKNKNKKKAAAAPASEKRAVEVVEVVSSPGSEKSGKHKPEKKNAPAEPSPVAASPSRPKIVVRPTEPGPVTVFRKRQSSQPVSDVSEPDLEDDEQTQRGHESPRKSGKVQGGDKAAGGKMSWAQKLQAGGRSKADAVPPPSLAKQGAVQAQGETAEDTLTAAPTLAPAPQGKARRRQRTLSQTAEHEGSDDGGGVFPAKRQPKEDLKASNPWQEKKLERERAQARASKHGAWAGRPGTEEAAGAIGNSSVPEREPNKAKQSKAAPNADVKATQAKIEAAEKAKQLVAPLPSFLKPETEAQREEQRPEGAQSASASASASAVALSLQSLDRDASPLSTPTSAPSSPASSRSSVKADHQPDASSANAERQVRQSTDTRNAHESEAARRPRTGQDRQREMPVGVPMPMMMPMPMQMGIPMQSQMPMPMHPGAHQHGQMPAQAMWQGQPMHPQAVAQMQHFNAMQQQLFEQRLRCRQALEQQVCTTALTHTPSNTPTKTASLRRFCSTFRPTTSAAISFCGLTWMLMDSSSFVRSL